MSEPNYDLMTYEALGELIRKVEEGISELQELVNEHKEIIKKAKAAAESRMVVSGARAVSTSYGTFHFTSSTTARVMDPALLQNFVICENQPGAIDWKANAVWCRNYAEEYKTPVPGVELSSFRQLRITTPRPVKNQLKEKS